MSLTLMMRLDLVRIGKAPSSTTDYDSNGKLTDFSFTRQGWYDVTNKHAENVPEPAFAIGLGAAATVGAIRRKRPAKV